MTLEEYIDYAEEQSEWMSKYAMIDIYKDKSEYYRQLAELLSELKRDRKILDGLSIYFQSLVVDAVINQRPLMFDMRDATKEERESVKQYIADSVSTTGVNFWSFIGEVNTDE